MHDQPVIADPRDGVANYARLLRTNRVEKRSATVTARPGPKTSQVKIQGGRCAARRHLNFVFDLVGLNRLTTAAAHYPRTMPGPGSQRLPLPHAGCIRCFHA